jgi:hypothetical protein
MLPRSLHEALNRLLRPELARTDFGAATPDVIARQVDMLPAQK